MAGPCGEDASLIACVWKSVVRLTESGLKDEQLLHTSACLCCPRAICKRTGGCRVQRRLATDGFGEEVKCRVVGCRPAALG